MISGRLRMLVNLWEQPIEILVETQTNVPAKY